MPPVPPGATRYHPVPPGVPLHSAPFIPDGYFHEVKMCYRLTRCSVRDGTFESCAAMKGRDGGALSPFTLFRTPTSIHRAIHLFTLVPPSVSYFCVTVPGGFVS